MGHNRKSENWIKTSSKEFKENEAELIIQPLAVGFQALGAERMNNNLYVLYVWVWGEYM